MSSSTTISRALMALSLTFTFGLVTSAAAVEAETGAPFSAASDPQVGYTPGTLATLLPIEVRVLVGGENEILAGDCHAAQVGTNPLNRRLVCPALARRP